MAKYLVTGVAGFIGSSIAAALLAGLVLSAGWLAGTGMLLPLACFTALLLSLLSAWALLDIAQHQLKGIK